MLFSSSLVMAVAYKDTDKDLSPERITLFSIDEETRIICSSSPFASQIKSAKLNKKRIVVLEGNSIHIFSNPNMELLHSIEVTNLNVDKMCLSSSSDYRCYLCYCPDSAEGFVKIFNLITLSYEIKIKAHRTAINRIAISNDGQKLATCSEKGTVIRVFNLESGEKIGTFKRGITYATIYSLFFSADNERLVLSSDTGTFHVFNLQLKAEEGMFGGLFQKVLPKEYKDTVAERAELSCKQTEIKCRHLAFFRAKFNNHICLFGENGAMCVYEVDYKNAEADVVVSSDLTKKRLTE